MITISDQLYAKAAQRGVPLGGALELSPVCNFHCPMCYVRKTPAQIAQEGKSLISRQQWEALAEECRSMGTLYLLLTGGEPFLYPDFRRLYESLHRKGFLLSINTNGSMIDEKVMPWLKQAAPSRVNVTLYGASPESYERISGQGSGFERTMKALRLLTEAGIPVVINASMIPENERELEQIAQIGREFGANTRISTYMFPPVRRERESTDSRFTPQRAAEMFMRRIKCQLEPKALHEMLLRKQQQDDSTEDWGAQREESMRCRAGRSSFWISWEGKMTACGLFPLPVETEPFRDGFASCWQRLTKAVKEMTVLEQCRGCKLREVCNPCAATVYAECGDVNGKADYLCQMARCITENITAYLEKEGE